MLTAVDPAYDVVRRVEAFDATQKKALAAHPGIRPNVQVVLLEELWRQQDAGVETSAARATLAHNPGLAPVVAEMLLDDPDEMVRGTLAMNPTVDLEVQTRLVGDPSPWVRTHLASRADLSGALFHALAAGGPDVQSTLALHPALPPELVRAFGSDARVRASLASRHDLPTDVALLIARDEDPRGRRVLAMNLAVEPQVQLVLLESATPEIRWALAENPSVTDEVVAVLRLDRDEMLVRRLVNTLGSRVDPDFPDACLRDLYPEAAAYRSAYLEGCDEEVLATLARGWSGTLRELRAAVDAFSL